MDRAVDPRARPAVAVVREHRNRQILFGHNGGARDVARQTAAVPEPVPALERAADDPKTIIFFAVSMGVAPMPAVRLRSTEYIQRASRGARRELREVTAKIARGRHKAAGGRDRVLRKVARKDHTLAQQELGAMAASESRSCRQGHVRRRFLQAGRIDDFALDPSRIWLIHDGLNHETKKSEAVIGIFEPRIGLDDWVRGQIRQHLPRAEIRPTAVILADVATISGDTGAMGENLPDRGPGDRRVQLAHIVADGIVELELALLTQLHRPRGGETFRVRGDAESMARSQLFASREIGGSESLLEQDLVLQRDRHRAARLTRGTKLQLDPGRNVIDRRAQPFVL